MSSTRRRTQRLPPCNRSSSPDVPLGRAAWSRTSSTRSPFRWTGGPGLRFGLWIEDSDFPVRPAQPPDFPLPRLLPAAEGPCFDATSGLPVPAPIGFSPGFALGIPVETLQRLLDAVAPSVK